MVQEEINRGRHTDHPAGRHSIRTNQCPPPPYPIFFYGPDALPAAQPTVSKHWRQRIDRKDIRPIKTWATEPFIPKGSAMEQAEEEKRWELAEVHPENGS